MMAEFQVVCGLKSQPKEMWHVYSIDGVNTWWNPQDANAVCKNLNKYYKAHANNWAAMLKRLPDPVDYLMRETAREDYKPFEVQGQDFHCAELKNDGTISYYNTQYDAYDDKRTSVKLGRYLRKFCTDKDDKEIGEICARYGYEFGDSSLFFAKTREEIKNVYEKGPNSCMSGPASNFSIGDGIHPAEAYASGDFEVAYITRDERITGRAVVIPSKKIWSCIYGDNTRMRPMLEELGYKEAERHEAHGLKMLKLGVVMDMWQHHI